VRDPAFAARVFWLSLALVLLWPLGVATEFRLWVLWAPENRKVTADLVRSFWPLVHTTEFLQMVLRETWRTVAMATAGVTLALVLAVPLSLSGAPLSTKPSRGSKTALRTPMRALTASPRGSPRGSATC
jgi:phosphonate transport system permease protein